MQGGFPPGSSPRLWGTPSPGCGATHRPRFIPTPVGNTLLHHLLQKFQPVHPHACGEHTPATMLRLMLDGSSPRLWGTPRGFTPQEHAFRFIPTPVGNTSLPRNNSPHFAVHPHACGEHKGILYFSPSYTGSSPRLWGTPSHPDAYLYGTRFIPTPVGNTG